MRRDTLWMLHAGCGELITDYEGIGGHGQFRGDLGAMYFPTLDATGALRHVEILPTRMRRFRLELARGEDRTWLAATLRRECQRFAVELATPAVGPFVVTPQAG